VDAAPGSRGRRPRGLSLVPCNELRRQGTSSPCGASPASHRDRRPSYATASLALCVAPLREPAGQVGLGVAVASQPLERRRVRRARPTASSRRLIQCRSTK
jgi:hypothetical protein